MSQPFISYLRVIRCCTSNLYRKARVITGNRLSGNGETPPPAITGISTIRVPGTHYSLSGLAVPTALRIVTQDQQGFYLIG